MKRAWSDDELALVAALRNGGATASLVSAVLGRPLYSVYYAFARDERLRYEAARRKAHPRLYDEWRATKPLEHHRESRRAWRARQPKGFRLAEKLRSRARMSAAGTFSQSDFELTIALQSGKCFDCEQPGKLTVGHLRPLYLGGDNSAENIVGQCLSCNCKQGRNLHPSLLRSA